MTRTTKKLAALACVFGLTGPAGAVQPPPPAGAARCHQPPLGTEPDLDATRAALERVARDHPDPAARKGAADALKALDAAVAPDPSVGVRDAGGLFGKGATAKANAALRELKQSLGLAVAIDVAPGLPADKAGTFQDDRAKWEFVWGWARERAAARGNKGLYLLVFKESGGGWSWQFVTSDPGKFSNADARRASDAFAAKLGTPDDALAELVAVTRDSARGNAEKAKEKKDAGAVPPPPPVETEKARRLRELEAKRAEYQADVLRCEKDVIYWRGEVAANPKSLSAPIALSGAEYGLSVYRAKLEGVELEIQSLGRP